MRIDILGYPIDSLTKEEVISKIVSFLNDGNPHFSVAINPEKLMKAVVDQELSEIIQESDLNFVDGIGVAWASRIFYHKKIRGRITGVDLMGDVLKLAENMHLRVYLLGTEENSIQKAVAKIKEQYKNLNIAGFHNGYFSSEEDIVNEIGKSLSNIIFIGMGSPKQEKFIARNLKKLNVNFAMGVGGSFNVYAGKFKRAPQLIQRLGLEWFYRFILDPKRLPRIMKLPKFLMLVAHHPKNNKSDVFFLGIKISNRDMESNIKVAEDFIREGGFHLVVTLNGEMASRAINDKGFLDILKESDLVLPDGVGVVWGAKRFGEKITHRIPGIEFAWELMRFAEKSSYSIYFLGAQEEVLKEAVEKIKNAFPNLKIAGMHHGYLENCENEVISDIKDKHPVILFIGMGGIKQEKWIVKNKDLGVPVNVGIGGSFDVWAGRIKRAPYFIRRTGLEWLYRTVTQPSRLLRAGNLVSFALKIIFKRDFQ